MKRDVILNGAIAGLIGNIIKLLLTYILYFFGLLNVTFIHIAGGYFQNHNLDSVYAIFNALIADFFYAAFLGVLICLALRFTHWKHPKLKGFIIGGFLHIIHNGILVFENFNNVPLDEVSVFYLTFPTLLFGISTAWFNEKLETGRDNSESQ